LKVLLEIEGGFTKEIFNGEKAEVKLFLQGFKDIMPLINTASTKEEAIKSLLGVMAMSYDTSWVVGAIARLDNNKGNLKVVE
jgi:hypothetical protein